MFTLFIHCYCVSCLIQCKFDVIDIIQNCGRPSIEIDPFLERLMTRVSSVVLEQADRRKLVKILGTYLFAKFGS